MAVAEAKLRRFAARKGQVYGLQVPRLAGILPQVAEQDRPQHGRVCREDVAHRPGFLLIQQARGERHLTSGDCYRILTGRVRVFYPVTYAVGGPQKRAKERVIGERLGVHG